eukprot:COSAG05_NODE_2349_length_3195_cov_18.782332_2_plen_343_part_00
MEEGAQFHGVWLETQPMAGAMYATRNARIALDNQLVFMRAQAPDGYMPGQVGRRRLQLFEPTILQDDEEPAHRHGGGGGRGAGGGIQGLFFASPATDVAWILQQTQNTTTSSSNSSNSSIHSAAAAAAAAQAYMAELTTVLEGYDAWLWTARNTSAICHPASFGCVGGAGHAPKIGSGRGGTNATACCRGEAVGTPQRGLLWSDGINDSGEDSSTRFCKVANHTGGYQPCVVSYAFPIQSADVTSYSYDCRASLARLARMRGDHPGASRWEAKASAVRLNLKAQLWDTERQSMFSRDAAGVQKLQRCIDLSLSLSLSLSLCVCVCVCRSSRTVALPTAGFNR